MAEEKSDLEKIRERIEQRLAEHKAHVQYLSGDSRDASQVVYQQRAIKTLNEVLEIFDDTVKESSVGTEEERGSTIESLKQQSTEAMRSGKVAAAVRLYNQAWEMEHSIKRSEV